LATKETITQSGLDNSSTQLNPKDSVLLGMIGEGKTRGQVAILDIEAANNQNCAAIWVPETDVPPEFVYAWLWSRYEDTRRGSSGNNQPALNKSLVERMPLPLPPVSEAVEIVVRLEVQLQAIAEQELFIDRLLHQSTAQRQNILRAAFSGQLVPQDPDDEPASVLLERIRAKRVAVKRPRGRNKITRD
jgi:type I restriction enzyme S subunit